MIDLFEINRRRCEEIQANAAFIASLRNQDELRFAAQTHASGCPDCAAALAEGALLMALIDDGLSDPVVVPPAGASTRFDAPGASDRAG